MSSLMTKHFATQYFKPISQRYRSKAINSSFRSPRCFNPRPQQFCDKENIETETNRSSKASLKGQPTSNLHLLNVQPQQENINKISFFKRLNIYDPKHLLKRSYHIISVKFTAFREVVQYSTMTAVLGEKEIRLPLPVVETISTENKSEDLNLGFYDVISSCAKCLTGGGVIAVPTDTIYGVACLAQDTQAVNRLYDIKQRNFQKPVAISVAKIDDIYSWGKVTVPRSLLEDLLPGPVTVVFERSASLNPALNPNTKLVGIRIPGHKFMQDLAKECAGPVALTSANISGATSCLKVEEFDSLWSRLDLVVNGGTLSDCEESRLGSTVVDLSVAGEFRIIRPGSAYVPTSACLKEKYGLVETSEDSQR